MNEEIVVILGGVEVTVQIFSGPTLSFTGDDGVVQQVLAAQNAANEAAGQAIAAAEEVEGALSLYVPLASKGQIGGVASLDASGKVPLTQLPPGSSAVSSVNSKTGVVVLNANDVGALNKASNLSDLPSLSAARTNLGLGTAAVRDVGVANGVPPLGPDNLIPGSYLPPSGSYKGVWNASTNSPTITSGMGTNGDFYVVGTAGTTNIDGISSWAVGDQIRFNGTVWQKIAANSAVSSVNGQTGTVVLGYGDVNAPSVTGQGLNVPAFKNAMKMAPEVVLTPEQFKTGGNTWDDALDAMDNAGSDGAIFSFANFTYPLTRPHVWERWSFATYRFAQTVFNYTGTNANVPANGAILTIGGTVVSQLYGLKSEGILRVKSATTLSRTKWAIRVVNTVYSEYDGLQVDNGDGTGGHYNGIWFDQFGYVTYNNGGKITVPGEAMRINGAANDSAGFGLGGIKGSGNIGLRIGGATGGLYSTGIIDFINCNVSGLIDDRIARGPADGTYPMGVPRPNREVMFSPNFSFDGGDAASLLVDQLSANFYLGLHGVWTCSASGGTYVDVDRKIQGTYIGGWNANTNSPTITSSVGEAETFYVVTTAGSTNINGTSSWAVNDVIRFNGSVWQKIAGFPNVVQNVSSAGHGTWLYKGPNTYAEGAIYAYLNSGDGGRNQDPNAVGKVEIVSRLNNGYGWNDLANNGAGTSSGINYSVTGTATLGLTNLTALPPAIREHVGRLWGLQIATKNGFAVGPSETDLRMFMQVVGDDTQVAFAPNDFLRYLTASDALVMYINSVEKMRVDSMAASFGVPLYTPLNTSAVLPGEGFSSEFIKSGSPNTVRKVWRLGGTVYYADIIATGTIP